MKTSIFLAFSLCFFNIQAQSFLLTTSDEKYDLNEVSIKIKSDQIMIKSDDKKMSFDNDLVKGYYSFSDNTFYYLKRNLHNFNSFYNKNVGENFIFIERVIEGKIKLYKKEVIVTGGFGSNFTAKNIYWFIEKDNDFFTIYIQGRLLSGNKNSFEKFKPFVEDNIAIRDIVNNENYKHNIPTLTRILKNYNKDFYSQKASESLNSNSKNKITFYRDNKKQSKEPIEIRVNEKTYFLNRNEKTEVSIPTNKESLICIDNSSNDSCEIIKCSKYFMKYYKVSLDKKKRGTILRKNGNSSYLNARLKYFHEKKQN